MAKPRILIVDSHPVVREGIKKILSEESSVVVADEVAGGREALERIKKRSCDMLILEIALPDRSGLDVLKTIQGNSRDVKTVVFSIYPEESHAVRALRAGASAYLSKESTPEDLLLAVRKVSSGGRYVSSFLAEKLAGDLQADREKPPHEILSDREFEVMCMISEGKTAKEIAEKLFLSVKTIHTYRYRILRKMGMRNNSELMQYAIKNQLVQ